MFYRPGPRVAQGTSRPYPLVRGTAPLRHVWPACPACASPGTLRCTLVGPRVPASEAGGGRSGRGPPSARDSERALLPCRGRSGSRPPGSRRRRGGGPERDGSSPGLGPYTCPRRPPTSLPCRVLDSRPRLPQAPRSLPAAAAPPSCLSTRVGPDPTPPVPSRGGGRVLGSSSGIRLPLAEPSYRLLSGLGRGGGSEPARRGRGAQGLSGPLRSGSRRRQGGAGRETSRVSGAPPRRVRLLPRPRRRAETGRPDLGGGAGLAGAGALGRTGARHVSERPEPGREGGPSRPGPGSGSPSLGLGGVGRTGPSGYPSGYPQRYPQRCPRGGR